MLRCTAFAGGHGATPVVQVLEAFPERRRIGGVSHAPATCLVLREPPIWICASDQKGNQAEARQGAEGHSTAMCHDDALFVTLRRHGC